MNYCVLLIDMSKTLTLAQQLIAKPSVTPNDAGCQDILANRLATQGFTVEHLNYGDVTNLWARLGNQSPVFVFAGHTDVVPPGPIEQWTSNPFVPTIRNNILYGRGAADMKSSLAAMIVATENFLRKHPQPRGSIAFLITSDEEGQAINGTAKVVEELKNRGETINYCVIGEASSTQQLGDMIKIGRRGSLSAHLTVHGIQGHIAYPDKADNPIFRTIPVLQKLIENNWDSISTAERESANATFPPTSLQISNIHSGTGANNVIPGILETDFNFRYGPATTAEKIQQGVLNILDEYKLRYEILWSHSGKPFLTTPGLLLQTAQKVCQTITSVSPILSTSGGTSDGRFIATMGCELIELGPPNATIHQINECIKLTNLDELTTIYELILEQLLVNVENSLD
jgi:succinyl-diaminopimelate desuccinylase